MKKLHPWQIEMIDELHEIKNKHFIPTTIGIGKAMNSRAFNKIGPSDLNRIFNCMTSGPSLLDLMRELVAEQNEDLLAVMAAGVPTNCISLVPPEQSTYDFKTNTASIGFKFTRSL